MGLQDRLKKWMNVRENEGVMAFLAFAYFFFLLSGYYILRPVRDEMGIQGGVRQLPWLFTGTFIAIMSAVPLYAAIASRFPVRQFVPLVYRFFNANLLFFWILFQWGQSTEWVARSFFIWTSVFNLFVVSVFWSLMVDVFKKEQADRLFGFIAGGGTLGALTGPLVTMNLVRLIGTTHLLLISCLFLEITVYFIRQIIRRAGRQAEHETQPIGGNIFNGIKMVFRSPYLLMIALYVFLMSTGSTFLYLTQAEIFSSAMSDPSQRTFTFATIDLGVNVLTFLVQTFLTGLIITRLGLAFSLALLPLTMAVGLGLLSFAPGVSLMIFIQMLTRALRYAITHPAREILFTVTNREEKYKSKNFIDTVVYRGGDAASAWFFHALQAVIPTAPLLWVGVMTALAWLGTGLGLAKKNLVLRRESAL